MVELFMLGEPLFMFLLTIPLLALVAVALNPYHQSLNRYAFAQDHASRSKAIRSIGLFAFIFGLFVQLLGLYGALESIRVWGEVEADILYGGLAISSIPTGYGLLIFVLAWLISKLSNRPTTAVR